MPLEQYFIQNTAAVAKFESDLRTLFDSSNLNQTEHRKEQVDLERLLELCTKGDAQGYPYIITKWWHFPSEKSEEFYLDTCYPLEISTSQGGRSMGHCSDFILFVYYSGARLNPQYNEAIHAEKVKRCPNSTFLHGEYPLWIQFESGARNFWMPNIEQVSIKQEKFISKTSKFLAKTQKTFTILKKYLEEKDLNIPIVRTFHSTPDPLYQLEIPGKRNFGRFFHANGHSGLKSTIELIECWKNHPDFPLLTIIGKNEVVELPNIRYHYFLNISELRRTQWENGIHICPSVREGFGHYINEARGMGAMLITTDFGPMNEFLNNNSGVLVKNSGLLHEDYQLFTNIQVKVSANGICDAVKIVLGKSYTTREEMGKSGRVQFQDDYKKMKQSKTELKLDTVSYFRGFSISNDQVDDFLWNLEKKISSHAQSLGMQVECNSCLI